MAKARMLALTVYGELRQVVAPDAESAVDTIRAAVASDITDVAPLGPGLEMWFDAEALENYDYEPRPNGYASALAFQLGGIRELRFGTVVFAGVGSDKGQPISLRTRHAIRIAELLAAMTTGVAQRKAQS
jgi:hypothetical protein